MSAQVLGQEADPREDAAVDPCHVLEREEVPAAQGRRHPRSANRRRDLAPDLLDVRAETRIPHDVDLDARGDPLQEHLVDPIGALDKHILEIQKGQDPVEHLILVGLLTGLLLLFLLQSLLAFDVHIRSAEPPPE